MARIIVFILLGYTIFIHMRSCAKSDELTKELTFMQAYTEDLHASLAKLKTQLTNCKKQKDKVCLPQVIELPCENEPCEPCDRCKSWAELCLED